MLHCVIYMSLQPCVTLNMLSFFPFFPPEQHPLQDGSVSITYLNAICPCINGVKFPPINAQIDIASWHVFSERRLLSELH